MYFSAHVHGENGMATRYFRGRIDFDRLSMSEISEVAAAMAVLEKLAEKEGFDFVSGRSRQGVPRPDMAGPRSTERPLFQRRVLVTLRKGGPMLFDDLLESCGLKSGSISPALSALFKEGLLEKTKLLTGERGRGRNKDTSYNLNDSGVEVADRVIEAGNTPFV